MKLGRQQPEPPRQPPTAVRLPDLLAETQYFQPRFALFLREFGDLWRNRRTDTFTPFELHAAEHRMTIQAVIDVPLLDGFFTTEPAFAEYEVKVRNGDKVPVFVPTVRMQKRLLVAFEMTDSSNRSLPLVSRVDDSPMIADLILRKCEQATELTAAESQSLWLLLTLLVFINPFDLAFAVANWLEDQFGKSRDWRDFCHHRPLTDETLRSWVKSEGDIYGNTNGIGDALTVALRPLFASDHESLLRFAPGTPVRAWRRDRREGLSPLRYFQSVSRLVAHAPRDVARVIERYAPPPDAASVFAIRKKLGWEDLSEYRVAAQLGAQVSEFLVPGVAAFQKAVEANAGLLPLLVDSLETWTPFAALEVEVGRPFVLHIDELLPLGEWRLMPGERKRRLRFAEHHYNLELQDAPSFHVEVAIPNPEIRIPPSTLAPLPLPRRVSFTGFDSEQGVFLRGATSVIFDGEARMSERRLHFYATRGATEVHPVNRIKGLVLVIPLKLSRDVWWGFAAAVGGLWSAATFIGFEAWWRAAIQGRQPDYLPQVLTLAALSVSVGLWIVQSQYASGLVARKLRLFRWGIIAALVSILLAMGALTGAAVARGGHLGPRPSSNKQRQSDSTLHRAGTQAPSAKGSTLAPTQTSAPPVVPSGGRP